MSVTACENATEDSNKQDTANNSEIQPTEGGNPCASIAEEYQSGASEFAIEGSIDRTYFSQFMGEYAEYCGQMSEYIQDHKEEFDSGKTFKDFDDYEESFSDFYHWANRLIYYNGDVQEEYQSGWEKFTEVLSYHIDILNRAYDEDAETAAKSIEELSQYVTEALQTIISLLPIPEVMIGDLVSINDFAEIEIKEVSYQTRINPTDTSGVYSYYEVQNTENIYLACNFNFTNLQTTSGYSLEDFISFQVVYEGGYTYTGWSVAEDSGSLSPYPDLRPLTTYNSWYLIEVPKKLQDTPYSLTFTMNETTYQVKTD